MAMSFSRPDPSSPNAVSAASFSTARRGFDQAEVREFLRMVAAELARLQEREKFLERELRTAQRGTPNAQVALDEELVTRLLGEEAARILQTARDGASQIKIRAEDNAARLLREATDEAQRLREEAEVEAARRRQDASSDAEAELQMAKQQGREMVNEARAYRERVLGELARRRELARQQIEQLVHGRDRLLQAFERARLAAVDVMAELTPLGEPSEYVNLSPTTGPVPLMVPNARPPVLDEAEAAALAEAEAAASAEAAEPGDATTAIMAVFDGAADADELEEFAAVEDEIEAEIEAEIEEELDAELEAELAEAELEELEGELADELEAALDADIAESEADDVAVESIEVVEVEVEVEMDDADDDADEAPLAPVVALFAGEVDPPGIDDSPLPPSAPKASVDDLFARLRASRADTVVERARAGAVDTSHPVFADDSDEADEPAADAPVAAEPTAVEPAPVDATGPLSVFAPSPEAPEEEVVAADTPFAVRDAALTPLIVAGARKLKRVLADEQNDVLHSLRRGKAVQSIDVLVPKASEHIARYASAIDDELREAAMAGAAGIDDRDRGAHEKDIKKSKAIDPAVELLATMLVDPLRERLDRAVADAAGDNGELTDLVRGIYRDWKTQRIDEHLDDVVRTAYGRGALAGVGTGTPVMWAVDPSVPVCADCDDNALAGAVAAGQPFPTDHLCAPGHPGCRCMLVRAHS